MAGRWNCFILLDSVASYLNDQRGARVKNIKWKTQIKRKRDFELNTLEDSVFALDVLFQKNSERGPVKVVKCQLARFTQFKKKKTSLAVRSLRADTVSSSSENSLFQINLLARVCRGPRGERPYPGHGVTAT